LNLKEVADYWHAITKMNEHQKDRFTRRIISCLFNNLSGKRLAVLGFAFKKDTSDTRESPAITLVSNFVAEQANVAIYDPKVKEEQIWRELVDYGGVDETLKHNVEICSTAYAACEAADAVVIVTEWDEFSNRTLADERLVLKEVSPNRLQVSEMSANRERPRAAGPATLSKPVLENMTGGTTSVRSFDVGAVDPTTSSGRLDWARVAQGMRKPRYVFDGRNMLDHTKLEALGFRVEVIGKASKRPSPLQ
jgi:UDPglucose 6-dehydrogenase